MLGLRIARSCVHSASSPNSSTKAYIRASCEYQISSGEAAPNGGGDEAGAAVVELAPEQVERGDRERARR